jgi:endo-beta-N-acetylglucosaminidase D
MELTLGWKDILRPIRDGFRHLFPSPDTGPTPEERARQRKLDRLKGFTYFDTFQELEAWTEGEAIPVQRANTPLLPRSRRLGEGGESRARVLLCHDYAGNYHVYEASQGVGVDVKSYFCEHLQFVDTFIYFSHKLVCVPPPSWTNALHRNGVCVLGTLLLERQTRDVERLLQRTLDYRFPLATVLASVARCYGFDGWLVNVEKPFAIEQWEPEILEAFLKQLRQELGPGRKLIW